MASVRDVWMAAAATLQSALPADEVPRTSVLTRSYDNGRTGANLTETHFSRPLPGRPNGKSAA
jgi:hypothetical protein